MRTKKQLASGKLLLYFSLRQEGSIEKQLCLVSVLGFASISSRESGGGGGGVAA